MTKELEQWVERLSLDMALFYSREADRFSSDADTFRIELGWGHVIIEPVRPGIGKMIVPWPTPERLTFVPWILFTTHRRPCEVWDRFGWRLLVYRLEQRRLGVPGA